jgi:hypothetical protein
MSRSTRVPPLLLVALLAAPAAALAAPVLQDVATFTHYVNAFGGTAGETSIGYNPRTGNVFFQLLETTYRATFNDATTPATVQWRDVTPDAYVTTFDPLLYSNPRSGKTYVVHLALAASASYMTNDVPLPAGTATLSDGGPVCVQRFSSVCAANYWVETQPPTSFPFFDHQTVGAGPHAVVVPGVGNVDPATLAPSEADEADGVVDAMYYCGQLAFTVCARSDDDGLTWGPYVTANTACVGLSGHVKVDSQGAAYLPLKDCGSSGVGVAVSRTNGATWAMHFIPGSGSSLVDPYVAIASDDTTYVAMRSGGKPLFSKSVDHGTTWSTAAPVDPTGTIVNTGFVMAVAGDPQRAAVAFYGSTTPGDYQSSSYAGVWHLYVSYTLDGGATWTMVDTTPNDPVQRGCIWLQGGGNACRNLLDFQDATLDNGGRILIGYADGCVSSQCIGPNGIPSDSRASRGVVARQTFGPRMYAAFG